MVVAVFSFFSNHEKMMTRQKPRSLGHFDHRQRWRSVCCVAARAGRSPECCSGGSLRHDFGEEPDVQFAQRHRGGSVETSPGSGAKTGGR